MQGGDQQLLLLNEITGDEQPEEVPLTHSPFWVRIRNLLSIVGRKKMSG